MKILQVCHKPPYPNVDGGTFAEQSLTRLLVQSNHQVDLLSISTEKHPFKFEEFPDWLIKQGEVFNVKLSTFPTKSGAVKNLWSSASYITSRFKQPLFKKVLFEKATNQYDLIIFDGLVAAIYLPELKKTVNTKMVLRSHNLEFLVWENLGKKVDNLLKKGYFQLQSNRLKKEELEIFTQADAIWHLNSEELATFPNELRPKLAFLPVCINVYNTHLPKQNKEFTVGFLGAMNWQPNYEAGLFIKKDLSPILNTHQIKVLMAGRFQDDSLNANEYFNNLGEVEKQTDFFEQIDVFINPVFSGSGIRIKILDAIRYQRPIVSSAKGIEGWGLEEEKHFLLASNPQEFKEQCLRLKNDENLSKKLVENCLNHFQSKFGFESTQALLNQNLKNLF